tara:strand:+ start:70 stop:1614 length:1545 start_codon:yes stop_codon:yes gene_type:complete
MVEYKVLITTSGIGRRLGKLTDFTNKALIRVGDKPAISHIIEHYPKDTKFVITLGHYGNHIKDFLNLAYPDRKFEFVKIDKYKGPGSSLLYSISKTKLQLQCPFIFHASDTILTSKDSLPDLKYNWGAGAFKEETSQYRTLLITNNKISKINDKGELNFDYSYIGLCGIKDYKEFWKNLELILNESPQNDTLSDVHVINEMLKVYKFNFHKIDTWLDIGNTSELQKTRKHFNNEIEVLDKKDESIFMFEDFVIKFFSNSKISQNRVKRAKKLKDLVPEIIDSTKNFYKYKKAKGNLFSKSVNQKTFNSFLIWSKNNLWNPSKVKNFPDKCYDFYVTKSKKRILQYLNGKPDKEEYINGELIPSINEIFNQIDFEWLCNGIPSRFHGDFILDNIIETNEGFCLIDWRQDFAGELEIGDIYYDLAKLNHNLIINHGIVDQKQFDPSLKNCYILCNSTLVKCREILHKFIVENGYDSKKVEILSSIIWVNMAPLHEYPFSKFLFNFGKYNLYKCLNP